MSLKCKCGNEIEITVPMFTDKEENYVCKICFNNIKWIDEIIEKTEGYIKKLSEILENNLTKRKINDQLDLIIDDFIELLQEMRNTQKPIPKERIAYYTDNLEKRRIAIHDIAEKVKKVNIQ